jgi:hypothetical protein
MNRFISFCVLISLFSVRSIMADDADAVPASATTQPDFTLVDKLADGLKVRKHAANFTALVDLTKPKIVFGGRDMIWVMHDPAGKPIFAMNRAYDMQIGKEQPGCYLFDSNDSYYTDPPDDTVLVYTRFVDTHPIVVARDLDRGVVYQARWDSAPQSGSGAFTDTRNIFLLCDGSHHWHFLAEGPIGTRGRCGYDERFDDSVSADAQWPSDPNQPAQLSFTLSTTDSWGYDGDAYHEFMTVRRKMTPGQVDNPDFVDPADTADNSLRPFKRQGPYYVIAAKSESLDSFVRRFFHNEIKENNNQPKTAALLQSTETSLRASNPWLSTSIVKGETIILPEKMYRSSDE